MRFNFFLMVTATSLAYLTDAARVAYTSDEPLCPPRRATLEEQTRILADYVDTLYVQRNVSKALLKHVSEDYIQHNPNLLSGRQNSINGLTAFWPYVQSTVLRTSVGNNFGMVHSKSVQAGAVSAVADIFRFNGTCIMEHWDVIQSFPANSSNPIAMF